LAAVPAVGDSNNFPVTGFNQVEGVNAVVNPRNPVRIPLASKPPIDEPAKACPAPAAAKPPAIINGAAPAILPAVAK